MIYDDFFSRGYLISDSEINNYHINEWLSLKVNDFSFYFHKKTEFHLSSARNNRFHCVMVGCPTDVSDENCSVNEIVSRCLKKEEESREALIKYIAYLGGRFIAFLVEDEKITAIPDCHATYACYFSDSGGFCFASHSNLISSIKGYGPGRAQRIINNDDYQEPGGKYLPALVTPFDEVSQLFPNCKLEFDIRSKNCRHDRFYPFSDTNISQNVEFDKAYEQFEFYFLKNIKAIVKRENFYISLTGGLDSRVTLAGINKELLNSSCTAFTYYRPETPTEGSVFDMFKASQLSNAVNIPHKLIHLKSTDYSSDFHKMYSISFKYGARHPSLARAYYEELPKNIKSLVSTCSETGTVFYKNREEKKITPEVLAKKFTTSKINNNPEIISEFDRYIDFTQMKSDLINEFDFYDLFYWEHRNAKWASLWYAEADLSHFTIVPFNQRNIIESMLSLSLKDRESKEIIKFFIKNNLGIKFS
ncbi:hypothetical protein KV708_15315 [Comamonas thiooxydans]|uniref:hypothetical protein n=1 Tax=Comamonas thiooxydans TaxID=363952 RepID=UPI000A8C05DD|nr:hypothetical protein [Comamonas thiooxydans]